MTKYLYAAVIVMTCNYSFAQMSDGKKFSMHVGVQGMFNSFTHNGDFNDRRGSNYDAGPYLALGLGSDDVAWSANLALSTGLLRSTFTESLATFEAPLPFVPTTTYSFRISTIDQYINYTFKNSLALGVGGSVKMLHDAKSDFDINIIATSHKPQLYLSPVISSSFSLQRFQIRGIFDFIPGNIKLLDAPMMSTYNVRLQLGYKLM